MSFKNSTLLLISLTFVFIILFYYYKNHIEYNSKPTPTEFISKKKKKKEFKKSRKEWMENMHKSHPDDNWRLIDKQNRKINTDKVLSIREQISRSTNQEKPSNFKVRLSRNVQGEWFERGSNNLAGRIRTADIDFDNQVIYCASSGGNVWKGTLQGQNWESLNDYMQILGITFLRVINNNDDQRLLIGSENDGLYYSDNQGFTLNSAEGIENLNIKRYVMEPETNHIYLLANTNPISIYKSEDLGESFQLFISLNSNLGITSNDISDFDIFTPRYFRDDIFVIINTSLYKISNNTLSFVSSLPGNLSDDVLLSGGVGNNGTFLYAYIGGHIYKSINAGLNWISLGQSPSDWWWINGFNSSNIERDKIFVGGMELFKSLNGGNEWELINPWWEYYDDIDSKLHADIPEIRFFLDSEFNEIALISTDGGLYISNDYLDNVQNISLSGLGVSQYYSTYSQRFAPYSIFAGSQDQGLQKSVSGNMNGVQNFEQIISGDYGHLVSGDNGVSVWANYPGFTIYYPNISNSNSSLSLNFPGDGYLWLAPLSSHPESPQKAIIGGGSVSGGNRLIELSIENNQMVYDEQNYIFSGTISALAFSPIDSSYRYVLTENGRFYYSVDGGLNWSATPMFTGPSGHYFYGSTILPSSTHLGRVYIGGSGYSNSPVYISQNHGQNFSEMNQGLPNTLVFELSSTLDDNIIFAATEIGPYAYLANQEEWFLLSGLSAPDQTYWSVDFIPEINTARFGTYGRGIWDFVLDENYDLIFGDVNQDNNINIQDIIIMIGFILINDYPNELELLASDLNEDNSINVLDIVMVVDLIFGGN